MGGLRRYGGLTLVLLLLGLGLAWGSFRGMGEGTGRADADRGASPEKLADLCPKHLGQVPSDPCGHGPLHYARSGGEYVL